MLFKNLLVKQSGNSYPLRSSGKDTFFKNVFNIMGVESTQVHYTWSLSNMLRNKNII